MPNSNPNSTTAVWPQTSSKPLYFSFHKKNKNSIYFRAVLCCGSNLSNICEVCRTVPNTKWALVYVLPILFPSFTVILPPSPRRKNTRCVQRWTLRTTVLSGHGSIPDYYSSRELLNKSVGFGPAESKLFTYRRKCRAFSGRIHGRGAVTGTKYSLPMGRELGVLKGGKGDVKEQLWLDRAP